MRNLPQLDSPKRKTITQFKATMIDYDNINRYNVETLLNYARLEEITIPDNPSKQEIIYALNYRRNQNKKSISFSVASPKIFQMPESFKSIPKPINFGDENSVSQHRLSPILTNKRKIVNIHLPNHPMPCTPAAKFRTAFREKPPGTVSPVINCLAGSIKKISSESDKKSADICTSFLFFVSFFLSGSVATIIMLSVL